MPYSKQEEDGILNLLGPHKKPCLVAVNNLQEGKAAWLGMERLGRNWYLPNLDNDNLTEQLNYTNWDPTKCTTNDCGGAD